MIRKKARALAADFRKKKEVAETMIELYSPKTENFRFIKGNIESVELPEDLLVDTIFTSPPYYQLRKYGTDPE